MTIEMVYLTLSIHWRKKLPPQLRPRWGPIQSILSVDTSYSLNKFYKSRSMNGNQFIWQIGGLIFIKEKIIPSCLRYYISLLEITLNPKSDVNGIFKIYWEDLKGLVKKVWCMFRPDNLSWYLGAEHLDRSSTCIPDRLIIGRLLSWELLGMDHMR